MEDLNLDPVFDPAKLKKKLKAKKDAQTANGTLNDDQEPANIEPENIGVKNNIPTLYSYNLMLGKLYASLGVKPENDKIPYPIINITQGMAPSTYVKNFSQICEFVSRDPRHVMNYVYSEMKPKKLGINAADELWMRGRYDAKQILTVLKNFVNEYVLCRTCGSNSTKYEKKQGILFVACNKCEGKRPVPKIPEPKTD